MITTSSYTPSKKVIAYARKSQQIFVAQCVWWLASVIGHELGLFNHTDNLQSRVDVTVALKEEPATLAKVPKEEDFAPQDKVLEECEEFLEDSRRLRNLAELKGTGRSKTGRINPLKTSKKSHRVEKRNVTKAKDNTRTDGIKQDEIERRKCAGECVRCAWPSERKGSHRVKDCIRPVKLDKGTASYPTAKAYQRQKHPEDSSSNSEDPSTNTDTD
jgi:hypothetical protein